MLMKQTYPECKNIYIDGFHRFLPLVRLKHMLPMLVLRTLDGRKQIMLILITRELLHKPYSKQDQ